MGGVTNLQAEGIKLHSSSSSSSSSSSGGGGGGSGKQYFNS
jgi:hypothetical protein